MYVFYELYEFVLDTPKNQNPQPCSVQLPYGVIAITGKTVWSYNNITDKYITTCKSTP